MATRIPTGISVTGAQNFGAGDRGSAQQLNPQAVQSVSPARDPGESVSADAFGAAEGRALQNVGGALQGLASMARQLDEKRRTADDAAAANAYKFKLNTAYSRAYQEAQAGPTSGTEQFYSTLDQRFQELSSESLKELRDAGYRVSSDGEKKIEQIELGLRERYGVSAITFEHNARVKRLESDFKEQMTEIEDAVFTGASSADDAYSVVEDSLGQFEGVVAPDQLEQLKDTARKRVAIAEWRRLNEGDPEAAKKALGFSQAEPLRATDLPDEAATFLNTIASTEARSYNVINGGKTFSSFADHPRQSGAASTAAGRYQFVKDTWDRVAKANGFTDFSPENQDRGAWWLAQQDYKANTGRDLIADIQAGEYSKIKAGLGSTWEGIHKLSDAEFAKRMQSGGGPAGIISAPDERFADIPYEDRIKLNSQAEQAIAQQQIQVNDAYRLQIATDPQGMDPQVFLEDNRLDDGDKASLYNSWKSANKEALDRQGAVSWTAGSATANPFDAEDRKRAALAYEQLSAGGTPEQAQQAAEHILARKGVAAKPYLNEIKNGLNSNDVSAVLMSLQRAQRLATISRKGLTGAEGGVDVYNAAKDFETMTLGEGLTPEDAAQKYIDDRERRKSAGYETLLSEGKELAKEIENADIQSIFGFNKLSRGTGFAADVGYTGAQNAAMLGEFKEFFIDEYTKTGDGPTAKVRAEEKMRRLYGVSSMFLDESVITKFPPENYMPTVGGKYDYVIRQAADEVERITGKKYPDSSVFLLPDMQVTARDVQLREEGEPIIPRYQVWYVDEDGILDRAGEEDDYFVPDVKLGQERLKEQLRIDRAATKEQATFAEQSTPDEAVQSQLDAVRESALIGADERDAKLKQDRIQKEKDGKEARDKMFKALENGEFYQ